jgi:hypothetical protein
VAVLVGPPGFPAPPAEPEALLPHEKEVVLAGPFLGEQTAGVLVIVRVERGESEWFQRVVGHEQDVIAHPADDTSPGAWTVSCLRTTLSRG